MENEIARVLGPEYLRAVIEGELLEKALVRHRANAISEEVILLRQMADNAVLRSDMLKKYVAENQEIEAAK